MDEKPGKPPQFGLASLAWLMAGVALALAISTQPQLYAAIARVLLGAACTFVAVLIPHLFLGKLIERTRAATCRTAGLSALC